MIDSGNHGGRRATETSNLAQQFRCCYSCCSLPTLVTDSTYRGDNGPEPVSVCFAPMPSICASTTDAVRTNTAVALISTGFPSCRKRSDAAIYRMPLHLSARDPKPRTLHIFLHWSSHPLYFSSLVREAKWCFKTSRRGIFLVSPCATTEISVFSICLATRVMSSAVIAST